MAVPPKRCTVEEYDQFAMLPENADLLVEYIAGEMVETEPNVYVSMLGVNIGAELGKFIGRGQSSKGYITGAAAVYVVLGERYMPNLAYTSKSRLPTLSPHDFFGPIPPDLAVEIISPSDQPRHLLWKLAHYLRAGTTVWVVDPQEKLAEVFAPDQTACIARWDDTIHGGDVLPGFTLAVKEIFPD